jgi:hypothetical protein
MIFGPDYVRRLEDALLILWAELPANETLTIREGLPELADFLGHLHDHIEHEQVMVRRNVWDLDALGRAQ